MPTSKKSSFLTIRVTRKARDDFRKKAQRYGNPTTVHRELVHAFIEGRITIEPNTDQPSMEKLYHDH